jgi:uncharacterized protein YbaR (Trm112 family)
MASARPDPLISGCDPRVRPHLVCPRCRGELLDVADGLVCTPCALRYPVHDGVPWMLPERATRVRG